MEITLDRLKIIIGDKECQIIMLNGQIAQLTSAYNKLTEENRALKAEETEKVES